MKLLPDGVVGTERGFALVEPEDARVRLFFKGPKEPVPDDQHPPKVAPPVVAGVVHTVVAGSVGDPLDRGEDARQLGNFLGVGPELHDRVDRSVKVVHLHGN